MRPFVLIFFFALFHCALNTCHAQELSGSVRDTFNLSGQASAWTNVNHSSLLPVTLGGRYIPSLYYGIKPHGNQLVDFEASANIYGNFSFHPFDTSYATGDLKAYRLWMRYSADQFELRLGLQKINFGSASILRPLMWFDRMDPRDPLHLTDGVWALLARYYFLNNANIWLWSLYGNDDPSGWELIPSNINIPEFGGRIQVPVPKGEAAFSYHHRTADNSGMNGFDQSWEKIPEDRFGFDAKWDFMAGFWFEGSWTRKGKDLGPLTNQEIFNAGIDYTFGLGNGLYMAYEHLLFSYDENPFEFENMNSFSLLTATYTLNLFDKISAIVYYNWTENKIYNYFTWQKQFDKIILYVMGYWNPEEYNNIPAQTISQNMYAGKGIQLMFVFNH